MTDPEQHSNPSAQEAPRRLYTWPDSWIDLHPAENDRTQGSQHEGPPRYVVLERQTVVAGEGCAGCAPGCLTACMLGLILTGTAMLGLCWACFRALTGLWGLLRGRETPPSRNTW